MKIGTVFIFIVPLSICLGAQSVVADDSVGPAFQPARSWADLGEMLEDRIAKPKQSRKVARKLEKDGFESVTILTHSGGHRLVKAHIARALVVME